VEKHGLPQGLYVDRYSIYETTHGKTQFADIMQGLVQMPNVTELKTKYLRERFELYRFLKKTLIVAVDLDGDFLSTKGAAVIKGLVGGDWHDAEQKGGTGSFNMLATSNARLRVHLQGDLSAWKRGLCIVRFEAEQRALQILNLGALLVKKEGSGILNLGLVGVQKLMKELPNEGGKMVRSFRIKVLPHRRRLWRKHAIEYNERNTSNQSPRRHSNPPHQEEQTGLSAPFSPKHGWIQHARLGS